MKFSKTNQARTKVQLFSFLARHPEPFQHVVGDLPRRAAGYGSLREEALGAINALHLGGSKEAGFLPGFTKKTATELKAETAPEQNRLEKALHTPEAERTRTMQKKIVEANQFGSPLHQALRIEFPSMLNGKTPPEIDQWLTNRIMEDASWPQPYVKGIPTADADIELLVESTLDIELPTGKTICYHLQVLIDSYQLDCGASLIDLISTLDKQLDAKTDHSVKSLPAYKASESVIKRAQADFEKKIIFSVNDLKLHAVHESAHSTSAYLAGHCTSVNLTPSPYVVRGHDNQG
jgi:hypothetical protein